MILSSHFQSSKSIWFLYEAVAETFQMHRLNITELVFNIAGRLVKCDHKHTGCAKPFQILQLNLFGEISKAIILLITVVTVSHKYIHLNTEDTVYF